MRRIDLYLARATESEPSQPGFSGTPDGNPTGFVSLPRDGRYVGTWTGTAAGSQLEIIPAPGSGISLSRAWTGYWNLSTSRGGPPLKSVYMPTWGGKIQQLRDSTPAWALIAAPVLVVLAIILILKGKK